MEILSRMGHMICPLHTRISGVKIPYLVWLVIERLRIYEGI